MLDPRIPELLTIHAGGAHKSDSRWLVVEHSLSLTLPGSYKKLVDIFGASSWGNFLHVLSPFDDRLDLKRRGNQILDADRESRRQFLSHYPLPLHPEPGGLLPWAVTDNGDTLYFITLARPDEWPTLIRGARAPEFEVSYLHPALLVHHFASGKLRSGILPDLCQDDAESSAAPDSGR
jgi:hypothetical protein